MLRLSLYIYEYNDSINIYMHNCQTCIWQIYVLHKYIWCLVFLQLGQSSPTLPKQAATHSDASTTILSSKPLIGHQDHIAWEH